LIKIDPGPLAAASPPARSHIALNVREEDGNGAFWQLLRQFRLPVIRVEQGICPPISRSQFGCLERARPAIYEIAEVSRRLADCMPGLARPNCQGLLDNCHALRLRAPRLEPGKLVFETTPAANG
jgi:hypothetical protein